MVTFVCDEVQKNEPHCRPDPYCTPGVSHTFSIRDLKLVVCVHTRTIGGGGGTLINAVTMAVITTQSLTSSHSIIIYNVSHFGINQIHVLRRCVGQFSNARNKLQWIIYVFVDVLFHFVLGNPANQNCLLCKTSPNGSPVGEVRDFNKKS